MSNKDDLFNNIGGENKQPANMKKILVYVAIAFLVFVIGVIGFAIVQNKKNSEKDTIIPPETKTQQQPKEDNLFKQIPIENSNNNQNNQNTQNTQNAKPKNNIKEEVLKNSNQPVKEVVQKPKEIPAPTPAAVKKPVVNKPENSEKENKPAIKKEPEIFIPSPKKAVQKETPKKESVKKSVIKNRYYIQVAALLRHKQPSKKFLNLITRTGYKYKFFVTYTKLKNEKVKVTKILIGPFSSRAKAKNALKKIKANITQNAFIFKVK